MKPALGSKRELSRSGQGDAAAQEEGPGDAVGDGGPLLREVGHGDALLVELDEAVVEGAELLVGREGAGRVEGLRGGGGGPGVGPAPE